MVIAAGKVSRWITGRPVPCHLGARVSCRWHATWTEAKAENYNLWILLFSRCQLPLSWQLSCVQGYSIGGRVIVVSNWTGGEQSSRGPMPKNYRRLRSIIILFTQPLTTLAIWLVMSKCPFSGWSCVNARVNLA